MGCLEDPPSKKELQLIKAALGSLAYAGHAYTCPNGHTYFIGNCGLANQNATCPECGAAIGGSGHQLAAGNRGIDFSR